MQQKFVQLAVASNPVQRTLIEGSLKRASIPFSVIDGPAPEVILGALSPLVYLEFRVSPERLQEAKDVLCASGLVCEVSDRLLQRSLEEAVKPLLGKQERDFQQLLHLAEVNNKETVRALFDATIELDGGRELLEDLFFQMAGEGQGRLVVLARALREGTGDAFSDRFRSETTSGAKETRITLLGVLPELPPSPSRTQALAAALLDPDAEVRDAASEAMFDAEGEVFGYDPEASEQEREKAVEAMLEHSLPA